MTSTMPRMPNAFERHHRRYSSGAGALSSPTVSGFPQGSDSERPSSSGKLLSRAQHTQPPPPPRHDSVEHGQPIEETAVDMDVAEGVGNLNRWSSSTASSVSTHNRRHSSFSRRFSLSGTSFNPGFRALSPTKRRRSSEVQRETPTASSSPTSLPSLNRFSPLTIPNLGFSSSSKDENHTDKPLPPRPPAAVEQPASEYFEDNEQQHRALSPTKRLREPLLRGASNLSDIQEGSRATTPTPRDQHTGLNPPADVPLDKRLAKAQRSRESSPMKHERQKTSRDVDSAANASSINANPSSSVNRPSHRGTSKDKDKKMMLTKALQRANEAVQFDNQQAYLQAVTAYEEACGLLDAVMARTTAEYDRQKLTAIRGTYMSRIGELQRLVKPRTKHGHQVSITPSLDQALDEEIEAESAVAGLANRPANASPHQRQTSHQSTRSRTNSNLSKTSNLNSHAADPRHLRKASSGQERMPGRGRSHSTDASAISPLATSPPHLMPRQSAIPRPLSPRRSKRTDMDQIVSVERESDDVEGGMRPESGIMDARGPSRSGDTNSWLQVNDERDSAPSSPEPVRRAVTSKGPAFDAAIESAYDQGYEPYDPAEYEAELAQQATTNDPLADQSRFYEQRQIQIQPLSQKSGLQPDTGLLGALSDVDDGLDTDEEDRLLAEGDQTASTNLNVTQPTEPHVPRTSDSSGFSGHSGRTWGSSTASSLNTTGTSLGTVDENALLLSGDFKARQAAVSGASSSTSSATTPTALPSLSNTEQATTGMDARSRSRSPNIKDRRISAQKANKLRIETGVSNAGLDHARSVDNEVMGSDISKARTLNTIPPRTTSADTASAAFAKPKQTLEPGHTTSPYPSPLARSFQASALTPLTPSVTYMPPPPPSQSAEDSPQQTSSDELGERTFTPLKQSRSAVSLNTHTSDDMVNFPFSSSNLLGKNKTSQAESAMDGVSPTPAEGSRSPPQVVDYMQAFALLEDWDTGDTSEDFGIPQPLEPCPMNNLLRPWWFLRTMEELLSNPTGGLITNNLFISRNAWRVKVSKLRCIDDKVNACDLLTAALLKLSSVNMDDEEAVLREMRAFETVMDTVQRNLVAKLGKEIGPKGAAAAVKDAPPSSSSRGTAPGKETGGFNTGRFTWKKLRSKSSSTSLASTPRTAMVAGIVRGELGYTMDSLPMVDHTTQPRVRRNPQGFHRPAVDGPNANYCGALLRMSQASSVLDDITRQVIENGMRAKSERQVDLDLSVGHAVEFFNMYIMPFLLNDIVMILDKYLKRGTEWLLE